MMKQDAESRIRDTGYGIRDTKTEAAPSLPLLHPASCIPNPVVLKRVRWRARRGLLELDIVLGRFIEAHYEQLDEAERLAFEVLLDMPDNPLWDMIAGRTESGIPDAEQDQLRALLEKISAA